MTPPSTGQRLYSLDALRGFDMFWIMGAEAVVHSLATATGSPIWEAAAHQLSHPDWNGFRLYDLIFPLFLFLAGVATPYSVGRDLENGKSKQQMLLRVIRRGLVLVLLGIIYNNGLVLKPLAEIRFPSVLGRIGLAYMFANIIYLYTKQLGQIIWFCALLIGYWLLLSFTSAPGFPMGDLTMEGNFASYVDRLIIPGHLHLTIHDPEGLMSLFAAIVQVLFGYFAGNYILTKGKTPAMLNGLFVAGCVLIFTGFCWDMVFPINKKIWTSSYTIYTTGLALLVISIMIYLIEFQERKGWWSRFFDVFGKNALFIFRQIKAVL